MESAHGFALGISCVEVVLFAQDDSGPVSEQIVRREDDGRYTEL
jgi:hypothetical protein